MNNWRLLLLAVVAVLQPIGSFTESNLIDGRQECCDHRSNSFNQDTRLYGTYRKTTPEELRLSTPEYIREERGYDDRSDPITELRQSSLKTERRISSERAVRFNEETRFQRDQHRDRISVDARKSRQIRKDQNRRARDSDSRDSFSRYERDVLDSRRIRNIRMSRDEIKDNRVQNERLYRDTLIDSQDSRRVQNSGEIRRVSPTRDTLAAFRLENEEVARRESRRARSTTDKNRILSLGTRVNNVSEREERVDERRQRDQQRKSRDLSSTIGGGSYERVARRRQSRDTVELGHGRIIRENNKRKDEDRSKSDEHTLSRKRLNMLHASIGSADRTRALARESGILEATFRDERLVRSNDRNNERREASKDILRASRERIVERRQDSRVSRMLASTTRDERLVRSNDRNTERQEVSRDALRVSRDSTGDRRHDSRASRILETTTRNQRLVRSNGRTDERRDASRDMLRASRHATLRRQDSRVLRMLEITIRNERFVKNDGETERLQTLTRSLDRVSVLRAARDVRSVERDTHPQGERNVERLHKEKEQRDESKWSRVQAISILPESRHSAELRQESRITKQSRILRSMRTNERFEGNYRQPEERRVSREHALNRLTRDTEQSRELESPRTFRFVKRASYYERVSRYHTDIRNGRLDLPRETRNDNKENRNIVDSRLQQTGTTENIRDIRREVRERHDERVSRDRTMTRPTMERIEKQRHEARRTVKDIRDNGNEGIRNHAVRMNERFEVRRQREENRATRNRVSLEHESREILTARSRDVTSRDAERNIRSERISRNLGARRTNEREVRNRDLRAVEAVTLRESKIMTETEIQQNRYNLQEEHMNRRMIRAIRDMRIEAKHRSSDTIIAKDIRTDVRDIKRDAIDFRFRSLDSVPDIKSENEYAMNWQMIFYTLQGAYLCGLLMQMLTDKSNNTKTRNFTWWNFSSKDLVKVD